MRYASLLTRLLVFTLLFNALSPVGPAFAQEIPEEAYVSGLVGHAQSYGLTCESRSAADLAAFWGVSVSETEFFSNLPRSDNPEVGFVGNPNDSWGQIPPNSYGVHAKPVAKLLRQYGLDAKAQYDMSWGKLRREIAAGRPVIVWIIGSAWSGTAQTYVAKDGDEVTVAAFEHTMILIGYDESVVHLVDAGSGATITRPVSNFRTSWAVLGNMAVTVNGDSGGDEGEAPVEQPDPKPTGDTYVVKPGDYLKKLADEWGVAWQDIASLNGIYYPYIIYTGQVLKIPGGGSAPEQDPKPKPTEEAEKPKKTPATYTVKPGEYLMQIARELKLDWRAIADLNGLYPPYVVHPGQVLILPGSGNGEPAPAKPKPTSTPSPSNDDVPKTYTVERGDYLVAIARKFGLNWLEIAALNGISYPYIVYPGQVLRLR